MRNWLTIVPACEMHTQTLSEPYFSPELLTFLKKPIHFARILKKEKKY